MSGEGVSQEGKGITVLVLEAGDDGEDALGEATAAFTVSARAELAPDHRPPERALGEVVGW